jgi:hypothetical protein
MKFALCAVIAILGLLASPVGAQQPRPAAAGAGATTSNARRIATDHLEMTTYATNAVVTPGSAFSLVFEITPREGIHLYAPGDHQYKIVRVNLEANPGLVVHPVQYPAAEIYFFAPLKERVPVFQSPFTLTQRLTVSASPALARVDRITIKGSLDYQACDDRVCFLPKSVPVSYTVRLRHPATGRGSVPR